MNATAVIDAHEERLRRAMLDGDVAELEQLLAGDAVFTNQDGVRLGRDHDLATYRQGLLHLDAITVSDGVDVRILGDCAIVCLNAELRGSYAGQPFSDSFAYSRVWCRRGGEWRVEMAHCSRIVRGDAASGT